MKPHCDFGKGERKFFLTRAEAAPAMLRRILNLVPSAFFDGES